MRRESKRTLVVFSLASFLNDLGSDIIYPLWPLFLTEVLGVKMAILGLIDGLGEALVSISQGVSGYLSDKTGKRKVFIWLGYLFGALSRIGYSLSRTWYHLVPFKVMDRFGKMRGAPRDAMVSEISGKEKGRNFGILRLMDNLGADLGILLSVVLISFLEYRVIFFLAAIPSILSATLVFLLVKDKRGGVGYKLTFKGFSRDFKIFLALSSIFSLGCFSYSFLLVYSRRFFPRSTFVPILYLVFTMTAALFSLQFGKMSDKIGRKTVIAISYTLFGLMCVGFLMAKDPIWLFPLFILYGLHLGSYVPAQKAFVSELSPKKGLGSGIGFYQMVVGFFALPSSLIAGILWDNFGVQAPFYFSMGLTLVSLLMLKFVGE